VSDFTDFRQYAETLVAVYARCGAGPFLHREVAGIVPRQDIVRFACKNYFLRVQDRDGHRAREGLPATISALKERLASEVPLSALHTALNTLADYGITEGHYGPTDSGWAGYQYEIAASVAPFFDALTEKLRQGEVMYAPEAADVGL
jgi:hypothetical protein